ncbi:MAG: branched-chain amino acid transaminase [Azospirillaceae bacterium]
MLPMDDRDGTIWLDGALVPWREARLHVLSHGLHYGTSVFEGERVYGGQVFRLNAHSRRLIRSARLIAMPFTLSADALDAATRAVVDANGIADGYVRPVAWRGAEDMGLSAPDARTHVAIAAWPWPAVFGAAQRKRGIALVLSRWSRIPPAAIPIQAKAAGTYLNGAIARREAEAAGADDALLLDDRGDLAEATGANLFLVRDGGLATPIADHVLDGITRQTVIDIARRLGLRVEEARLPPTALETADEVLLTGTAYEITPVSRIGELRWPVGPVTRRLITAFDAEVRDEHAT